MFRFGGKIKLAGKEKRKREQKRVGKYPENKLFFQESCKRREMKFSSFKNSIILDR